MNKKKAIFLLLTLHSFMGWAKRCYNYNRRIKRQPCKYPLIKICLLAFLKMGQWYWNRRQ